MCNTWPEIASPVLRSGRYPTRRGILPRTQCAIALRSESRAPSARCVLYVVSWGVPAQQIRGAKSVEDLRHDARHADATYKVQHAPYTTCNQHNDTANIQTSPFKTQHIWVYMYSARNKTASSAATRQEGRLLVVGGLFRLKCSGACFPLHAASRTATTAGGWLSLWRASSVPMLSASSMP